MLLRRPGGASLLLLLIALAHASPSRAGLDLGSMQARHRALAGRDAPMAEPWAARAADDARASATLQFGQRPSATPALLGDPIVGGSGVRASHVLLDRVDGAPGVELRLGVTARFDDDELRLEGSRLGVPAGPGEVYLSYEPRHWGPGWFGSLILDAAAFPVGAFGWRGGARYAADASWSVDLFAGRLGGHAAPRHPKLIGMRGEWRPSSRWTLGVARTLQWGGEGRSESLDTLVDGLIGRDTAGVDGIDAENEPGNQLGAVDVRYDLALDRRLELGGYLQIVAEDKATIVPSRRMWLAGVDAGAAVGALSLRAIVELADTTAGKGRGLAYRHHLYPAGYTHRSLSLGHQAGGDIRLASAALLLERGPLFGLLALHGGRAQPGAQLFRPDDELRGIDVAMSASPSPGLSFGLSAHYWRAGADADRWALFYAQYSWR